MSEASPPSSATPASASKKSIGRGISYPFIDLEEAIAQARKFYVEERKSSVPVSSAMKHFGYSETSSGGRQTVSALLQFGLMEDEGRKDSRNVRLTNRALTILLGENDSEERTIALRECVQLPRIYSELLTKYGEELPSDSTLNYYLRREKDFNPKTVGAFIKDFRNSLAFVGKEKKSSNPGTSSESIQSGEPIVEVGDLVQWESSGVLQFASPRKVIAKQEHEGQWWVQVEGSNTGILLSEINVVEKAPIDQRAGSTPVAPRSLPPVFNTPLTQVSPSAPPLVGEKEWMRGRLSKEADYRLLITGEIGAREIGRLIKLLEVQKAVLDEDDTEDFK